MDLCYENVENTVHNVNSDFLVLYLVEGKYKLLVSNVLNMLREMEHLGKVQMLYFTDNLTWTALNPSN